MIHLVYVSDESALRGQPGILSLRDHDACMEIAATLPHSVRTSTSHPLRFAVISRPGLVLLSKA